MFIAPVVSPLRFTAMVRTLKAMTDFADVALICELDEQWSFVGSKARQHWLWYAYNTNLLSPPFLQH